MRRSGHIRWGQLKVGGLILVAFLVFLWVSFRVPGPSLISAKHTVWVYFDDVAGMVSGSPVRLGGVPIGQVSDISFDQYARRRQVGVELKIPGKQWKLLHADATASLGTVGVLGDIYVGIDPGSPGAPPLRDGTEIRAVETATLMNLGPRVSDTLDSLKLTLQVSTDLMRRIGRGEGTIGRLLTSDQLHSSLVRFADTGTETAAHLDRTRAQLAEQFADLSAQLSSLLRLAQSPNTTAGKLLTDRTLYDASVRTLGRVDSLTAALADTGGGSAGALLRDKALYVRTSSAVAAVESLIVQVEKHPNRFFKFSVF